MGNCNSKKVGTAHCQYDISVNYPSQMIGDKARAGTKANVKIEIIGRMGSTEPTTLNILFRGDFDSAKTDTFKLAILDVGEPLFCKLHIKEDGLSSDWSVDSINVLVHGLCHTFPCYSWLKDGFITPAAKTSCLHRGPYQREDIAIIKDHRMEHISEMCIKYKWRLLPKEGEAGFGLPQYTDSDQYTDLPRSSKWCMDRDVKLSHMAYLSNAEIVVKKDVGVFRLYDSIGDISQTLGQKTSSLTIIKL